MNQDGWFVRLLSTRGGASGAELVLDSPHRLVHRQSVGGVFLTDYRFGDSEPDQIGIQLRPMGHRSLRPSRTRHDPLSVAEAFRQAVILLGHAKYAIPLHFKFLMERFEFDIVQELEVAAPARLTLGTTTSRADNKDGTASRISVDGVLCDGSRILARCKAVARCVTPASYRRIRAGREGYVTHVRSRPPGSAVIRPLCVGRSEEEDVVLCVDLQAGGDLYCAPDPHSVALFDHSLDHIPGMVLFEAAIQAVRFRSNNPSVQLTRLTATFPVFTEWDSPCEINVATTAPVESENSRSLVTFKQAGISTAKLDLFTAST